MQRKKPHDITVSNHHADEELLLWEKWIKIRQSDTTRLGQTLNRPPVDLTMNVCEKVRDKKEWKTTLEHAQIMKKAKVRGRTWDQPDRLKQPCYCRPAYILQRTAAENGKPRIMEHISVPHYIQVNEKGMTGEPDKQALYKELDKDFMEYKSKREQELQKNILKIDPFKPDTAQLFVKGNRPKSPPPKLPPLPLIVIHAPKDPVEDNLSNVYAIRINDTVICKNIPGQSLDHLLKLKEEDWHIDCTSWSYYFNTPAKRAGRAKLRIQNLGTVALRYCWKKIKEPIPYLPEDLYGQVFFFNKNEDVLSPGQTKEICITFSSDIPGIYSEYWELSFANICFFDSMANKLCVHFNADSVEDIQKITKKIEIMKDRIDRRVIVTLAIDVINEAILKATTIQPEMYDYKSMFIEEDIFLMKNPVCFYHQTEVAEMSRLYTEMAPGTTWDLSISSWRDAMMMKDYDDRMKYYELLKKSHSDLLKPWHEGESLLKQKYRAINVLLAEMADSIDNAFKKLIEFFATSGIKLEEQETILGMRISLSSFDPVKQQTIHNLFYVHSYDIVADTIETCAGVLSSLDLNRWIDFDFCKK